MRHFVWTAALLTVLSVSAMAQAPAAPSAPRFVATVDLARLMQMHPEFKPKMEALMKQKNELEASITARQNIIREKAKKLEEDQTMRPGSDAYQQQVELITSELGKLDLEAKNEMRKLEVKNSQMLYDTFIDIKREIGAFCKANSIAQVTDIRKMEVIPTIPQTVMEEMDQRLVWSDDIIDLTNTIKTILYTKRGLPVPADAPQQTAGVPAAPAAPAQAAAQGVPAPGVPRR